MIYANEDAIANGMAVLDERAPGWERYVDLTILNISDGCRCILGQVGLKLAELNGLKVEERPDIYTRVALQNPNANYTHIFFKNDWHNGFGWLTDHIWEDVNVWECGFMPAYELDDAWIAAIKHRFDTGVFSDTEVA